jgi:hypothetical protein
MASDDDMGGPVDAAITIDAIDSMPELDCPQYCQAIGAACTGSNAQYGSMATCLATCATYLTGAPGEYSRNTLTCRMHFAQAATQDPGMHCRSAGPSGGAVCGSPCEAFCTIDLGVCTDRNIVYTASECQTACAGFNPVPPYDASQTTGNTLSCRIYHATAASLTPSIHCAHTAVQSIVCQ